MEFPFDLAALAGAPPDHAGPFVGRVDEAMLQGRRGLFEVLDVVGKASMVAQGLKKPVTMGTPHLMGQRIYLLVDGRTALGLLKVGPKRLFVAPPPMVNGRDCGSDVTDALREINPLCALDFYVHESCQRSGFGRLIYDTMLAEESVRPEQLAYDRPSEKFLGFLRKHFGLTQYRGQSNAFVVFDEYWSRGKDNGSRGGLGRRSGSLKAGYGAGPGAEPPRSQSWGQASGAPPPLGGAPPHLGGTLPPLGAPSHALGGAPPSDFLQRGMMAPQEQPRPPLMPGGRASHHAAASGPYHAGPPSGRGGGGLFAQAPFATDAGGSRQGSSSRSQPPPGGRSFIRPPVGGGGSPPDWLDAEVQAAGAPARSVTGGSGASRSASLPCGWERSGGAGGGAAGMPSGHGRGTSGSGGGGSSSRFASPLSHAGQRMVGR